MLGWFSWAKIAAGLAALGALLLAVAKIFGAGRRAAEADGMRQQLDNVGKRNEIEDQVRRAGPDAVHDELRRDWRRD